MADAGPQAKGGKRSEAKRFYHENNRNSDPILAEDKPGEWIAVRDSSNGPDRKRTSNRFVRLKVE